MIDIDILLMRLKLFAGGKVNSGSVRFLQQLLLS